MAECKNNSSSHLISCSVYFFFFRYVREDARNVAAAAVANVKGTEKRKEQQRQNGSKLNEVNNF